MSRDRLPLVSVHMPAHNAAEWIGQAIESIRCQTYPRWELVIVDDGSTDATMSVASSYARRDGRILLHSMPHAGCAAARNRCAALSRGEVIARQDADDLSDLGRIELQVVRLLRSGADCVTTGFDWLLEDGTRREIQTRGLEPSAYLEGRGGPACATVVAWREVYEGAGPFDEDRVAGTDGAWVVRALRAGFTRWEHLPEPLYTQRRHPGQLSQRHYREQRRCLEDELGL